jgi:Mrp family chromosome partitioning ATPase/capsular polysaccharide biosynthesis protein
MNSMEPQTLGLAALRPLRQHYEAYAFTTLALLWRRRRVIAGFCVAALVIAGLVTIFMNNRYTAEVLIQVRLAREDQKPQPGTVTPPPAIAIDAMSVIETEARIIRSRVIAKRVVARLELTKDPAFAVRDSLATRAFGLLMSMWPWSDTPPSPSAENLIAATLMRNLTVTNDPKSYLIAVSYSSTSAERSARIANAFAEEYLRTRSEAEARREFSDLAATYGPQHPILLSAQAKLDEALRRPHVSDSAQLVMLAEPIALPSGPNRPVIVGLALLGAFVVGIVVVLLLERADNGFRTDTELATETDLRCLAILPEISRADPDASAVYSEAARAIAAADGLAKPPMDSKVVLVTSSVPGEGKSLLSVTLAHTLIDMGRRTLIIDVSPKHPTSGASTTSEALEQVLTAIDLGLPSLERQQAQRFSFLSRTSGMDGSHKLVTCPAFSKLLTQARNLYEVVLIEAPAVMLFADALYLGRSADLVLHVVRWNSTPRRTVAAALQRMRNFGIRIDGVVLSRVDQEEHWRHTGVDPRHYFTFPAAPPAQDSLAAEEGTKAA